MKKNRNRKYIKLPVKLKRKIVTIPRKKHHMILHYIKKKHNVSRKTLFYMKEYGPHSHIISVIIKESVLILLLASVLSSVGGIGLEAIKGKLLTIIPLLILLPALNDMIGDYGTIISSKFTVALYEGKIKEKWWKSKFVHELAIVIFSIVIITGIYVSVIAYGIAYLQGFPFTMELFNKVVFITMISIVSIVSLIFILSILGGLKIYKMQYDPNNFLIPMTTAVADIGSMIIFSILIALFF